MIQVIDNEIKQYRLPRTGELSDGTTVSAYHLLPIEVLKSEGWLPLIDEPPDYNLEKEYLIPSYVIHDTKVVKEYEIKSILKSEYEIVKEEVRKLVLEKDLSAEEMLDKINIYPDWENIKVGEYIDNNTILKYKDNLYQVINGKAHNKQLDRTPLVASLFNKIVPPGVVGEWVQPLGGHDAYNIGDKATHNGELWECVQGDANGKNSWEPGVYGWKLV